MDDSKNKPFFWYIAGFLSSVFIFVTFYISLRLFASEPKTDILDNERGFESKEIQENQQSVSLDDFIEQRASLQGIEPNIVRAIINLESNNNPYAIGIVVKNGNELFKSLDNSENRQYMDIRIDKTGRLVSIVAKNREVAERVFDYINENIATFEIQTIDYGLMQINSATIKSYELDSKDIFLNPYYNIALGIDVLKSCFKAFSQSQFFTIECYNKGTDEKRLLNLDYYDRFVAEYDRIIKRN